MKAEVLSSGVLPYGMSLCMSIHLWLEKILACCLQ